MEEEQLPQITPEEMLEYQEEMKAQQEDAEADTQESQYTENPEYAEAYGAPPEFEVKNKDAFLHRAAFGKQDMFGKQEADDTLRTTYLNQEELGRPMFTVRFLLDLHDLSKYYLDPIVNEINKLKVNELDKSNPERKVKLNNEIAQYIWEKIQNITASGMSNEGFLTNLTASRKLEIARRKYDSTRIENLKGSKKEK